MGSSSLGQLGTPKIRPVETFDWFDEAGITIGNVSSLVLVDFLDRAEAIPETEQKQALTLIREAFTSIVAEEDFPRFWAESIRQKQEADDLMRLMMKLIEALGQGRPTKRQSGSRPGLPSTGLKSKVGSSSRKVRDRLERGGRADLALAVRVVEDGRKSA